MKAVYQLINQNDGTISSHGQSQTSFQTEFPDFIFYIISTSITSSPNPIVNSRHAVSVR